MIKIALIAIAFIVSLIALAVILLMLGRVQDPEKIRKGSLWFAAGAAIVAVVAAIWVTNPKWLQNMKRRMYE